MATELRLLGDVEVLVDGRRLDVGHARQRCVLVALLADVNQPVPAEQLIDRVWAGDPPHRVRNALAGYLSRLRALFAGSDEVTITREPGGYMLSTDPSAVDLHRFRRLVADARSSAEPARAADLFDEALSLWRGELCTTLDTPWVNELRTALEVERLSIVSERNDAALNAGRHAELLADLVAASRAHPLDERLAGQLMLAQYGSGRQAEALDTYRRTRQRLVDELGVDPSPTLRAAYQRILDGDSDRARRRRRWERRGFRRRIHCPGA
ncbi:AfsR/SARP family transcriptional regulator [Mycolicibacterium vanbaalenii]|uniref:AfsR/SARP family transcriptional regulator n=1 Tax=Mycolicibacterium vanbaalenii TaxID=110539 RepID=UPI0021F30178|nr:AfsR/SARP family transcriptional regulator [Mycolicibacterium vanbaalenii]